MRNLKTALICLASVLALAACGGVRFDQQTAGKLDGRLFVMWVGEGSGSGDGKFVFVPAPHDPLRFTHARSDGTTRTIRPGLMYTDGGSIPRIVQPFAGFSPWGYAPAYMIHDWLFFARHCIVNGKDEPRFDDVRDVNFDESAAILGQVIRTLIDSGQVAKNDLAPPAITGAVDSLVARKLWDSPEGCVDVTGQDYAAVKKEFPDVRTARLRSFEMAARVKLPEGVTPQPSGRSARIVADLAFGVSRGR